MKSALRRATRRDVDKHYVDGRANIERDQTRPDPEFDHDYQPGWEYQSELTLNTRRIMGR